VSRQGPGGGQKESIFFGRFFRGRSVAGGGADLDGLFNGLVDLAEKIGKGIGRKPAHLDELDRDFFCGPENLLVDRGHGGFLSRLC
jgi:hypothetical protein